MIDASLRIATRRTAEPRNAPRRAASQRNGNQLPRG